MASLRRSVEEHLGAFLEQRGFALHSSVVISDFPFSRLVYVSDKYWIEFEYERGAVVCIIGSTQFQVPDNYDYTGSSKSMDGPKLQIQLEYATEMWQALEYLKLRPIPPDPFSYSEGSVDEQVRRLADALIEHGDAILSDDVLVSQIKSLTEYRRQRAEELFASARAGYEARRAAGKAGQHHLISPQNWLFIVCVALIALVGVLMVIWMIANSLYQP